MKKNVYTGADAWHHSRLVCDRDPQGAMPAGGTVRLTLHVCPALLQEGVSAALRLWTDHGEVLVNGALETSAEEANKEPAEEAAEEAPAEEAPVEEAAAEEAPAQE